MPARVKPCGLSLFLEHPMAEDQIQDRIRAQVQLAFRNIPALSSLSGDLNMSQQSQIMKAISEHAVDPTVFEDRSPFVFVAQISNSMVDYYYTRMDPTTTLQNFVEDAINGVGFMDSHNTYQQPLGRTFAAGLAGTVDGNFSVYAGTYILPDLQNQAVNTTHIIDSIRAGITKDVSVGFKRGDGYMLRCSICGGDIRDYEECPHIQGMEYNVPDQQGDLQPRMAIAWIVNARLAEVSGVYDGATPNAMIEKATNFAARGLLSPNERSILEHNYRMILPKSATTADPGKRRSETDVSNSQKKEGERKMEVDEKVNEALSKEADGLTSLLRSLGIVKPEEKVLTVSDGTRKMEVEIVRLREIETQLSEFKKAETEDAIAQGVRAQGDKFDKERYTKLFERASVAEVRTFGKEWEAAADATLGGGRRSKEDGDDTTGTEGGEGGENDKREVGPELPMMLPESSYMAR
jgi:hypothetical protein